MLLEHQTIWRRCSEPKLRLMSGNIPFVGLLDVTSPLHDNRVDPQPTAGMLDPAGCTRPSIPDVHKPGMHLGPCCKLHDKAAPVGLHDGALLSLPAGPQLLQHLQVEVSRPTHDFGRPGALGGSLPGSFRHLRECDPSMRHLAWRRVRGCTRFEASIRDLSAAQIQVYAHTA